MGALVRALSAGFANGARKRPGDEFELPDGVKPGKWLEVIEPEAEPAKAKAKKDAADKGKPTEDLV